MLPSPLPSPRLKFFAGGGVQIAAEVGLERELSNHSSDFGGGAEKRAPESLEPSKSGAWHQVSLLCLCLPYFRMRRLALCARAYRGVICVVWQDAHTRILMPSPRVPRNAFQYGRMSLPAWLLLVLAPYIASPYWYWHLVPDIQHALRLTHYCFHTKTFSTIYFCPITPTPDQPHTTLFFLRVPRSESKHKKAQTQYSLCQACLFLSLISQCTHR